MAGRIEVDNKIRTIIESKAKNYPQCVSDYLYSKNLSVRTMQTYLKIIEKFIDEVQKPMESVTSDDINKYVYSMNDCSESHKATTYSALKSFFDYMVKSKKMETNPFDIIDRIKVPRKNGNERNDFLTQEEIKIFLDNVHNGVGTHRAKAHQKRMRDRDLAIVYLFLHTGMRLSALTELDVNNLDFDTKRISITTKGKKTQVYNGLDMVFLFLEYWMQKRETLFPKSDAVFINERGERLTSTSIENLIIKYASNIEGKRITPHKLRATYASMLDKNGMDIETICTLMGHANIETTRIYIRGKEDKTAEAANIMSKLCE